MLVMKNELPHPTVITESGRALTAHHTVLISMLLVLEIATNFTAITPPDEDAP